MQLTTCYLSGLLSEAKEAHTRYMERFALEGATPPEHTWEDWYARFIMQKIKDREYNELFTPVDVSCKLDGNVPPVGEETRKREAWEFGL